MVCSAAMNARARQMSLLEEEGPAGAAADAAGAAPQRLTWTWEKVPGLTISVR